MTIEVENKIMQDHKGLAELWTDFVDWTSRLEEVEVLTITKPTERQKEILSRTGLTHILKKDFNAKPFAENVVYV